MEIDREAFLASLGGTAAVDSMNSEAKADALEDFMMQRLNEQGFGLAQGASGKYPTMAEVEAQVETAAIPIFATLLQIARA